MTSDDKTMKRIEEAISMRHAGDLDGAGQRLTEIWQEITPNGDLFHHTALGGKPPISRVNNAPGQYT